MNNQLKYRQKNSQKNWHVSQFNQYCQEKELQRDCTKILINQLTEYEKVKQILSEFKTTVQFGEYDTLFKLYKLQKYSLDMKYFKGSKYKYYTLSKLKSIFNLVSLNENIECNTPYIKLVSDFVNAIKDYSKPFSKNLAKKRKVDSLVQCGALTKQELDFINSEIVQVQQVVKDSKKRRFIMKKGNCATPEQLKNYQILIDECDKDISYLSKLLPSFAKDSLKNYLRFIIQAKKGEEFRGNCPRSLRDMLISQFGNVKKEIKVKSEMPKLKRKYTKKSNLVSVTSNSSYMLVMKGKGTSFKVVKTHESKDYLMGYKDALKDDNLKIYQVID